MLRGDVDRFYQALRREHPTPPSEPIRRLDHVREIAAYYGKLSQEERLHLLAWAKKEESGIGIIPLALSAIPFFGLIISARLQDALSQLPIWQVFLVWILFGSLVLFGFYIHQRQKAYTMLHIVLLEQAIKQEEQRMRQPQQPQPCEPEPAPQPHAPPLEEDRRLTLPPEPGTR